MMSNTIALAGWETECGAGRGDADGELGEATESVLQPGLFEYLSLSGYVGFSSRKPCAASYV